VEDKLVRFTRPGLTEEYSVSVDGVRQDFVIAAPPVGAGDLRVELALSGARAEEAAGGVRLRLDGSGRALAYSRLRMEDVTGRELTARLEVLSADRLAVSVADANAAYPVRIDPTFSDADWVSLNPGVPGANGSVYAIVADGNGNVYFGGDFTVIGTVSANYVAKWDGNTWSALGSGMNSPVHALAVDGTNLYAGGSFTTAGGVSAVRIAKWIGSSWSALGSAMDGIVWALAVSGTDIYAGGYFTTAGEVSASFIAKWDGSTWSALGSGMSGYVWALAVDGTDLYAGGDFDRAGEVLASSIARWDGGSWSALGSGIDQYVFALAVSGSTLYAGGYFRHAGGVTATNIAQWNGSTWSSLGSGMNFDGEVHALAVTGTNLYAGGDFFTAGGVTANCAAEWNGSAWSALGSSLTGNGGFIGALAVSGTNLYAGGDLDTAGGEAVNNVAEWDGTAWKAVASGMNDWVKALAVSGTNLYAGGSFTTAGGLPANNITIWDGNAWSALAGGMAGPVTGFKSAVLALTVSGTNLYAGGNFTTAGGVTVNSIARWDGSTWSALGSGVAGKNGAVYALAVSGNVLYAGGSFITAGGVEANGIARWDGKAWSTLGSGVNGDVRALAVSGTDLYAGGCFTTVGGVVATNVARWNGSAWSALGPGITARSSYPGAYVYALAASETNLYAGGCFTTAGGAAATNIAKWNGRAWSSLGSGIGGTYYPFVYVYALAVSGTDLYAGGYFTTAGGTAANHIAGWAGEGWSALGSGIDTGITPGDAPGVYALAVDNGGALYVGGGFSLAGTNVSPYIAQANVGKAPIILGPPQTQTAEAGATAQLAVDAAGEPPPVYQWYFNGSYLLSGTSPSLRLPDLAETDWRGIRARIRDGPEAGKGG
jgi:hypothetical protein